MYGVGLWDLILYLFMHAEYVLPNLFGIELFCNIMNHFTVTFYQFSASFLVEACFCHWIKNKTDFFLRIAWYKLTKVSY